MTPQGSKSKERGHTNAVCATTHAPSPGKHSRRQVLVEKTALISEAYGILVVAKPPGQSCLPSPWSWYNTITSTQD